MAKVNVEEIKRKSRKLRGTISESLGNESGSFSEEENNLLKFHGVYQQDDRDWRTELKKAGKEKAYSCMVRTKLPGGALSAVQYLHLDEICETLTDGTMRATSRQTIQLHGVIKSNLKRCISRINEVNISTFGACGDVSRNVMTTPLPINKLVIKEVQELAVSISNALFPSTSAYNEIWLDGEKVDLENEEEPLYGEIYLPRKFKIGIAVPPRNDVDIYTHDLGFVPHHNGRGTEGYTVLVGGGMGMSHNQQETHPILAKPIFYIRKEDAIKTAIAVMTVQRDYGNRENRKRARLKYLIEEKGLAWFRAEVESRLEDVKVSEPKNLAWDTVADLFGRGEQGDGRLFYGLWIPNGRIKDTEKGHYRSALKDILVTFNCPVKLTPSQNIIIHDIKPEDMDAVESLLKKYKIPDPAGLTAARKGSMACVALPTCGLSLAESERVFGGVMDKIDKVLLELGLCKDDILIRMTGCPNGCVRPYNADFGFVGRAPNKYAMFIGGSKAGDRLAGLEHRMVTLDEIPEKVRSYLETYTAERKNGESFSEYWGRIHPAGGNPTPEQFHLEPSKREEAVKE